MKTSDELKVQSIYTREELKKKFAISDATINTGIFQPKGYQSIWLFITKNKTPDRTQYEDRLEGDDLYCDGQPKRRKDRLLINHEVQGNEILLFYREKKLQYKGAGFRNEGPFRYISHEVRGTSKPSHFHFLRLTAGVADELILEAVKTSNEIMGNVEVFTREATTFPTRSLALVRQTTYWVYEPDGGSFGPGKFVGYVGMDFRKYERAVNGKSKGVRFDGHMTKSAIEAALGDGFKGNAGMAEELKRWGVGLLGPGTFDGIDTSKWQFLFLPAIRRYWAALANPAIYKIDEAINDLDETLWTVKRSDVRKGDRLAIWRGKGARGKRGIIAFAEVLSDPADMEDLPEEADYWIKPLDSPIQRRVRIRYVRSPGLPLWLVDDATGFLDSLSVARATGGGIFKLKPDQWRKLIEMGGGWTSEGGEDLEDEIAEAIHRVRARTGGQGFSSSPQVRKAVEKRAMVIAQEHFEGMGYTVTVKGKPYDLHCAKGNETLYVEVKGMQEAGRTIFLTRNEVRFAQDHAPHIALFVVHGIVVKGAPASPMASGGLPRIHNPWDIEAGELSPVTYEYTVPIVVIP